MKYISCRDIQNRRHRVNVTELIFRPAVYALIFRGKKILLSRQGDGFDFPGGGVERGESLQRALRREVREETGLQVTPGRIIEVTQDFFISIESRRKLHSILIYYLYHNPRGKVSTAYLKGFEKKYIKSAEWVKLEDIKKIKFNNVVDSAALILRALTMSCTQSSFS